MAREAAVKLSVFASSAELGCIQFYQQDSGGWFVAFSEIVFSQERIRYFPCKMKIRPLKANYTSA